MLDIVKIVWSPQLTNFSLKDKLKLQTAIYEWLYDEIDTDNELRVAKEAQGWKIYLHETSESKLPVFRSLVPDGATLNPNIPHGITLKNVKEVHVFLENSSSYFPLYGGIRSGFTAIAHEIAHMIVSILVDIGIFPNRIKYKHPDKRVPAGIEANTEVVLVHDRIWEINAGIEKPRKFMLFGWKIFGINIGTVEFSGIEIRDWVN